MAGSRARRFLMQMFGDFTVREVFEALDHIKLRRRRRAAARHSSDADNAHQSTATSSKPSVQTSERNVDDTEGVRLPAASVTSHDAHTATTSASPAPDRRQESAGNVEQDISSIAQDTEKAIDNVGPQHPTALQAPMDSASPVGETSGLSNTETQETSAHTFSPDLPYFPSSEPPSLSLEASETLARIPMALHQFVRADAITTNKQIAGFCQVMGDDTNNYVVHNAYRPGIRPAILHAMLLAKKKVDSIRYHPSYIVLCSSNVLCTQLKNDCDKIRDLLAGEGIIVPGVGVFTGDMSDNEILRERGKRAPVIITTCGKLLHLHRTGCFSINRARKIVFDQLDCLTIYADDNDSKKVFGYLVSTQRVIVLVSAMTAIVKASWQELVPAGLQNLDNMIQVLNEDCNEMLEMSKYMAWADTASLNHPPTPAVGLITQLAAEGAQQLVLANFKSTISSVNMTGRLVVPDDFLPFHSELAPRNVRLENLEAFRSRQCQILVCARRGIYGAAFPFLPELVPLEIPNTFCEPRYILQWYSWICDQHKANVKEDYDLGPQPSIVFVYREGCPKFRRVIGELKDAGASLPDYVRKVL